MKILIVSQYFWPEDFRINETISFFNERNHSVTVLTGKPNYPEGKVYKDFKNNPKNYDEFEGAEIFRLPIISRGKTKFRLLLNYLSFIILGTLYGLVKFRNKKFDVIFVYEPSPITVGLPAIALSKKSKIPIVFWALDLWPETLEALNIIKSKLIIKFFKKLANFIYNNCTIVLCQSKSFVKNISHYLVDKDKARYFPSWSEDIIVNHATPKAKEIIDDPSFFKIIFAGNLAEAQDLNSVIKAIEIAKNHQKIKWIFIGDGRSYRWLEQQIIKRSLKNSVIMLGRYPPSRMPSFFRHADALLVSLKRSDAFSMVIPAKIQTYLKSGIPLIGMLDGDGRRVIDNANAGITCEAGDYVTLASIFKEISEMPIEDLQRMGQNGIRYATENFDKNSQLLMLEKFLLEATRIK